jgi:predicted enzyme related to lactoylglutathione lyase
MSDDTKQSAADTGKVVWFDLTVEDAGAVRDFYASVLGWVSTDVDMGTHQDYAMFAAVDAEGRPQGAPVAGICHARGPNVGMPPVWLSYVRVVDLGVAVGRVVEAGGRILREPKSLGAYGWMAVIEDPAGACLALMGPYEPPAAV